MKTYNLQPDQPTAPGVLARLRALVPARPLLFSEALRLAELQANRLLELTDIDSWPVPGEVVSELPRIRHGYTTLPTSGLSHWDGQNWVILLNRDEPSTRQRFTLLHEFKHVVDHGRTDRLYGGNDRVDSGTQAEQAADYFAGCVLMPKMLLKRAWSTGLQRPEQLAELFDVSPRAIEVRLAQLNLRAARQRCVPPTRIKPVNDQQNNTPYYYRALSANWPHAASPVATSSRELTHVNG